MCSQCINDLNNTDCKLDCKLHEECGVFGIIGSANDSPSTSAAKKCYYGLYALQHRGQESAGIASTDGKDIYQYKNIGLVGDVFRDETIFENLPGSMAIAHNRYSTTGASSLVNAQPLTVSYKGGWISAAHNGNLVNAHSLREEMEEQGSIFATTSDSEVILHLIARSNKSSVVDQIIEALQQVRGAWSVLFLTPKELIAVRDPFGIRPLCLGNKGDKWAVASESCAFDILGLDYVRTIKPGEMVILRENQEPEFLYPFDKPAKYAGCVFEYIYFSRPDSYVFGRPVDLVRRQMGHQLAKESPVPDADAVISVPDSSNTAALGYANQLGIKFELGLIRNHYVGRTFIQPVQDVRDISARIKYNAVRGILKDKKIVVIDDSIVRGTTSKKLVKILREAGAKEIHFRVASPPIIAPCFYGVDTPCKEKLIASCMNLDEIKEYLNVDSIAYLSLNGMLNLPEIRDMGLCMACFNEIYPVGTSDVTEDTK